MPAVAGTRRRAAPGTGLSPPYADAVTTPDPPSPLLDSPRPGPRPATSGEGPHRQLDQQASPALWGELVAFARTLEGVEEGHSQVSPADSRALFLTDLPVERDPKTSLAPGRRLEPVHLHGVDDTSVHLVLPAARGARLTELGWAEPHGHAEHGTEWMVYGPRDRAELDAVLQLIQESLAFARGAAVDQPWGDPLPAAYR